MANNRERALAPGTHVGTFIQLRAGHLAQGWNYEEFTNLTSQDVKNSKKNGRELISYHSWQLDC